MISYRKKGVDYFIVVTGPLPRHESRPSQPALSLTEAEEAELEELLKVTNISHIYIYISNLGLRKRVEKDC